MNLHLLPEETKLFIPQFVAAARASRWSDKNVFLCYAADLRLPAETIPLATPERVQEVIRAKGVTRVIVHGLQPHTYPLIERLAAAATPCRMDWIYWGESFESPHRILGPNTLRAYLRAKGASMATAWFLAQTRLGRTALGARSRHYARRVSACARHMHTVYHWSSSDVDRIKTTLRCPKLEHRPFFYDGFAKPQEGDRMVEQGLGVDAARCIVVGHSAMMRNNHLDALPGLLDYARDRDMIVVCPLSYSADHRSYVDEIEDLARRWPSGVFRALTQFYPLTSYLAFLARCGAYVAPGYGSLGAGNMIAFAMAGRIPIAPQQNTTALFLKSIGADVVVTPSADTAHTALSSTGGLVSARNEEVVGEFFSQQHLHDQHDALLGHG